MSIYIHTHACLDTCTARKERQQQTFTDKDYSRYFAFPIAAIKDHH